MSYKYELFDNKAWLYNTTTCEYQETHLPKLFNSDILDENFNVIESKIRNRDLVGTFSTSQIQRFGKNKKGNVIYLIQPLEINLPSFLIAYGGKTQGKIAVKFKFTKWTEKLPAGEIIEVIGNYNDDNMEKILMYHFNVYPKKTKLSCTDINPLESEITRKEYFESIFSIDPDNCEDIDDSLSIVTKGNLTVIGVHIAQPNYWLKLDELKSKINHQFSTLYLNGSRKDLWGESLTLTASLSEGDKKPAYTTLYYYDSDYNLVKTEDFPSWIINKKKLSYDNAHEHIDAEEIKAFTNNLEKITDYHDLVSHWMIKTNTTIGNKFADTMKIPYRVNIVDGTRSSSLNDMYDFLSDEIRTKFLLKKTEAAIYSIDENYHESLNVNNYCHFTSPIRRYIDTWIHFYITYPSLRECLSIDCLKLNNLDSCTKKFHRQINLDNTITRLFSESKTHQVEAYIYQIISNNVIEVYIPPINDCELGFVKLRLYNMKFDYLISKMKYDSYLELSTTDKSLQFRIGHKILINIDKIDGVLPKNKLKIYPVVNIIDLNKV